MRLIRAALCAAALLCATVAYAQDDESDPGTDAFNQGDYGAAFQAWEAKAGQGDPDAMTKLGSLYEIGYGTKRDFAKAAEWYEKAAQLGFVIAQYNLANLYYDGR